MKKMRTGAALLAGIGALALVGVWLLQSGAAGGWLSTEEKEDVKLRILTIGTADSGGTMVPVGNALAQAISDADPAIKVNTSASKGSLANVEGLRSGQIDLGLVSGDVAFCAYHGTEEFAEQPAPQLRAIAAVYPSISNWIVREQTGLVYVNELAGKRIALGPEGSTSEISARTALEVLGLNEKNATLENCGIGSGGAAVETGKFDALHGFAGIPISGMQELAEKVPCRILRYTEEELTEILARNPGYSKAVIPAGTYKGQTEEVETFGVKCLLSVSADLDEELVYKITKILYESVPELVERQSTLAFMADDDFLCRKLPIPLHPGAERYYKEQGLL